MTIMEFPSFLSSLIIASSATGTLIYYLLLYTHDKFKSRFLDVILFVSFVLTIATNALIIIAFYQATFHDKLGDEVIYPLVTYLFGMILIILSGIFVVLSKITQTK